MRFSLRTLLIMSILVAALLTGGYFLLQSSPRLLVLVAILLAAVVAAWISVYPERRFRTDLASRAPMDDAQFFLEFYATTDIPEDIPRRLKPIYCDFFGIETPKLRPNDRPPEIVEIDTVELIRDIEAEFGLRITDKDAEQIDGSFGSIVQYLAKRRGSS